MLRCLRSSSRSVVLCWCSLRITGALITLLACVVQKVHKQGEELCVLRTASLGIGTQVPMHHGLQGRAQLPQQVPRVRRQFPAHERTFKQGYLNTVTSN